MIFRKEKELEEFFRLLVKTRPEEFLGVAKILGVSLFIQGEEKHEEVSGDASDSSDTSDASATPQTSDNTSTLKARDPSTDCATSTVGCSTVDQPQQNITLTIHPRPFEEIFPDMIDKFYALKRKPRRQLLQVLREAAHDSKESD